jgi:hypothetical protein
MVRRNAGEGPGSRTAAVRSLISSSKTRRGRKLLELGALDQIGVRSPSSAVLPARVKLDEIGIG